MSSLKLILCLTQILFPNLSQFLWHYLRVGGPSQLEHLRNSGESTELLEAVLLSPSPLWVTESLCPSVPTTIAERHISLQRLFVVAVFFSLLFFLRIVSLETQETCISTQEMPKDKNPEFMQKLIFKFFWNYWVNFKARISCLYLYSVRNFTFW